MKVNGICTYKGECRTCCTVYKVTCNCCEDLYVRNTKTHFKNNGTALLICDPKVNAQ